MDEVTELVKTWNKKHKPGIDVILINDHGKQSHVRTFGKAYVVNGEPVISVEGRIGGCSLYQIKVKE